MNSCNFLPFLCFTSTTWTEPVPNLPVVFENYAKVNYGDAKSCIKTVTIGEYTESSGILKDPSNTKSKLEGWHDFYTAVSCEFTRWTMNRIFDFLRRTPLFRQRDLRNHRVYGKTFRRPFASSLRSFVGIDEFVERFVNVLHNFVSAHSDLTYYNDQAVISALMSLRFRIHLVLSSRGTDGRKSDRLPDDHVVQLITKELNALQRFSSTNCSAELSDNLYHPFTGYWTADFDETVTGLNTVENLLYSIRQLKLESNHPRCSVTQMLLENIVTPSLDDAVSRDVLRAECADSENEKTAIGAILRKIKESHDAELILRYQDCVIAAIVKLIFDKTLKVINAKPESTQVDGLVDQVNFNISKNIEYFPALFVDCFRYLKEISVSKAELNPEQNDFRTLLAVIEFKDGQTPFTNEMNENDENSDKNYIAGLLTRVIGNVDDFKCFNRSLKFQRTEYDKYYKTFISKRKINFLKRDVHQSGQKYMVCSFILQLYSICFQTIIYLNKRIENEEKFSIEVAVKNLVTIRNYILTTIKMNINNFLLLKMAYNIAVVLMSFIKRGNYESSCYMVRIFNVVMIELDTFGTKYCNQPYYNNLLINNVDLFHLGLGSFELVEKFMIKFFKTFDSSYDVNWLSKNTMRDDFEYISINYLNSIFVSNSNICTMYHENIIIFWKGKQLSVKQIFKNAPAFTLNSDDLYALYDIYFKFYIAVVYYEVREIIALKTLPKIKSRLGTAGKSFVNFKIDFFPQKLHKLVTDIIALWNIPFKQSTKEGENVDKFMSNALTTQKNKIEEQFTKFSIKFVGNQSSTASLFSHFLDSDTYEVFKIINSELEKYVKEVNIRFSKLLNVGKNLD